MNRLILLALLLFAGYRMVVWSVMIGVTLAVGWVLLNAEADTILQAIWFFVLGTSLCYIVMLLGWLIYKRN